MRVNAARAYKPGWSFEPSQRQWLDVPLLDAFRPSKGTDKEAVLYQPSTGRYWEFWGMEKTDRKVINSAGRSVDDWRAAWGGRIDSLDDNPGYFPTTPEGYKFGATAAGLALLGGLITNAEQRRGVVNQALHIGLPETRRDHWAWPAQRTDGGKINPNAIPQGVTFRLPHDLDLDRIDWTPMRGCWRAWRRSTGSSSATRLAPSSCMRKIHSRAEPAIRTLGRNPRVHVRSHR